jgi:mevalonate kinase
MAGLIQTVFDALFTGCGGIVEAARQAVEVGDVEKVGRLMTENHTLLQQMTVSCAELDDLVAAALAAGALGAKLSGAGRGGNMIALVEEEEGETAVTAALKTAGATNVLTTTLAPT